MSRYTVTLTDAPGLTADQISSLEAAFQAAINDQYGGEDHAAGALFAWNDQSTEDHIEAGGSDLLWPVAEAAARAELGDQVPAGARFLCTVTWPATAGG